MRLVLIALVAVALYFLYRKYGASSTPGQGDGSGAATASPPPNELDQLAQSQTELDQLDQYQQPGAPSDPVDGGVTVTLPGGISFQYFGDPSQFPDINDPQGFPYPLASGRNY